MKLSDIVIGQEYGATDHPRSNYRRTPRQVRVMEIVTETERVQGGTWTATPRMRNVRRVKVKVLDASIEKSWGYKIASAKKNTTVIVDAKQLVALWSDLAPAIREKAEEEQRKADAENAMVARITAILGKRHANEWGFWHVRTTGRGIELEVDDPKVLDKLLTLAEMGKAVDDSRVKANAA